MRCNVRKRIVTLLAVLFCAGLALGDQTVHENQAPLNQGAPVSIYSSNVSSAQSLTMDTALNPRSTHGDPTYWFAPTSSVQGSTACFIFGLYQRPTGSSTTTYCTVALVQTVTFDGNMTIGGRFPPTGGPILIPTGSCQIIDPRVQSVSAGNVNAYAWSSGPGSAFSSASNE